MKVTLNWLKEFVDISLPPKELADKLTLAGLEVEGMETVGAVPDSVITVKIEKMEKHPNADRLTLCEVSLGSERRKIVCGAKNMKEGDIVALAQPGSVLPDGKKIERQIRDVVSEGMLCSETELGLAEESNGLMILPPETPLGKPLSEAFPLSDTIFEINVTPNRSDCLSVLGIAREVSAITGNPLKLSTSRLPEGSFSLKDRLKVEVKDSLLCPRYTARMIQKVKIGPSPFWVQLRLRSVGMRPINNVVDATNYVMIERGQPLHAFDAEQIEKGLIRVERQNPPGTFKTLDELERNLEPSDLLIADPEKILAIAGVMGGLRSGISEKTHDLVLESAYFEPVAVRKTSKRLGLSTESSYRFERGVDPNGVLAASERLAELILAWAGGELSKEAIDTAAHPFSSKTLSLRPTRARTLLGYDSSEKEIEGILSRLQLQPKKSSEGSWQCQIPTYRRDLEREIDLVEEVARISGYERIPSILPGKFPPLERS
jgi:phenylalanyl-tRNA synthetase beta chain